MIIYSNTSQYTDCCIWSEKLNKYCTCKCLLTYYCTFPEGGVKEKDFMTGMNYCRPKSYNQLDLKPECHMTEVGHTQSESNNS